MGRLPNLFRLLGMFIAALGLVGLVSAAAVVWYLVPKLPSIETLKDVRLQVPLKIYSRDERLIGEFGEKRRTPLDLEEIPQTMTDAVIAAEDERFFAHPGVDWQGLARAVGHLLRTGEKGPGGSTITMQVARNFFLGREKTYVRKLNEILLALKIERELSKQEILELYFNKIFLGHRAYGVAAASQTYYGTELGQLTLPQLAMIAGLPKAPSRFNPIVNPDRAIARRNYVLGRMRELGYISDDAYRSAAQAPVTASLHGLAVEVEAPYVAEMVRVYMESRTGPEAYTAGYRVYTTLDCRLQDAANRALREALLAYDTRHGYRGPELHVPLGDDEEQWDKVLADVPRVGGLPPALITAVDEASAVAYTRPFGELNIPWSGLKWARAYIDENRRGPQPDKADAIVTAGDVLRLAPADEGWELTQLPQVEGALVAMDPADGAVVALVGGFDFYRSKFNRATQAQRQPGSSFKPFIYSAALDWGFTAASLINDAPVVFDDPGLEAVWRPENYSGKFFGPTRLREALTRSRNLVSIRLLRAIGVDYTIEYLQRFGFAAERLPRNLSLALGSGTVTPIELAAAYSVIANGGFRIEPYFVERVVEYDGSLLWRENPARACTECKTLRTPGALAESRALQTDVVNASRDDSMVDMVGPFLPGAEGDLGLMPESLAPRVIDAQNAWLINSMMRDVIKRGTGRRARQLGRRDLAGKTGTTNDQRDAWFSGFNPDLVVTTWVGFDQLQPLGNRETGARAALPMWMAFMREALRGVPERFMEQPEGLVTVRIDPQSGNIAAATQPNAIFETFRTEFVPKRLAERAVPTDSGATDRAFTEQLF